MDGARCGRRAVITCRFPSLERESAHDHGDGLAWRAVVTGLGVRKAVVMGLGVRERDVGLFALRR